MIDRTDPQDVAEQLDENVTNIDPGGDTVAGTPEQHGLFGGLGAAPDEPAAVEEELVTEPIVDSVASRDERLQPESLEEIRGPSDDLASVLLDDPDVDIGDLASDPSDLAPEEAALHVIDDANLG